MYSDTVKKDNQNRKMMIMIKLQILEKLVNDKKIDEKYLDAIMEDRTTYTKSDPKYNTYHLHIYSRVSSDGISVVFDQSNFDKFFNDEPYNVWIS